MNKPVAHQDRRYPTCPYCEAEHRRVYDTMDWAYRTNWEQVCPACGREYYVIARVSFGSYSDEMR